MAEHNHSLYIAPTLVRHSKPHAYRNHQISYLRHLRAIFPNDRHSSHDVVILRIQAKEPGVSLTNAKHAINGKEEAFILLVHCRLHTAVIQCLNDHCLFTAHLFYIAGNGALEFTTDGMVCSTFGAIACTRCNFIPGVTLGAQLDCQGDTLLRIQIERCHLWVVRLLVPLWVVDGVTHPCSNNARAFWRSAKSYDFIVAKVSPAIVGFSIKSTKDFRVCSSAWRRASSSLHASHFSSSP